MPRGSAPPADGTRHQVPAADNRTARRPEVARVSKFGAAAWPSMSGGLPLPAVALDAAGIGVALGARSIGAAGRRNTSPDPGRGRPHRPTGHGLPCLAVALGAAPIGAAG